jgi:hypothetical protein
MSTVTLTEPRADVSGGHDRLEVDRQEPLSHSGMPMPSSIRRCRLQAWGQRLIDSNIRRCSVPSIRCLHTLRNRVERLFNKLKNARRHPL